MPEALNGWQGYIPRHNGEKWEQVESHKGEEGYLNGEPYKIKLHGPLPSGWSEVLPEPTEAERCAARITEIKGELQALDTAKVRPMSAIIDGVGTDDERATLSGLNSQSDCLRAEMQMLEAFI